MFANPMANPIPELKGNILEDYPENILPELDKVLHYLQEKNNENNYNLREYSPTTIVMVYPDARTKINEFYETVKLVFIKEDFINTLRTGLDKHYLTQRGKDFDSFVKAKERKLAILNRLDKIEKRQDAEWVMKKGSFAMSLGAVIISIIALFIPIYCNTQDKNDNQPQLNKERIDSLKKRVKEIETSNTRAIIKDSIGNVDTIQVRRK